MTNLQKSPKTRLHKENALKHVALLTARHEYSPRLVFTRSVLSAALKQLVSSSGCRQTHRKRWGETTTNRLQNLCRTVSQSLRKNPRPEFAASFPWSPTATDTRGTLVTLWCTIENSVWLGVVCRTGQDQQRCRARSLCPRERNQPTHR